MKIFISWSGEQSKLIASTIKEWLLTFFPGIDPFFSTEDIRKGNLWANKVTAALEENNFGIVCLNNENLESPWILFEAGALSKSTQNSRLFTLLFGDLKPSDMKEPLAMFQHTTFEKEDFFKMVSEINLAMKANRESSRLRKAFDVSWPDLETNVSTILRTTFDLKKKPRPPEEIWNEILELTRQLAKKSSFTELSRTPEDDNEQIRRDHIAFNKIWKFLIKHMKTDNEQLAYIVSKAVGGSLSETALIISYSDEYYQKLIRYENSAIDILKRALSVYGLEDRIIKFRNLDNQAVFASTSVYV